MTGKTKEQLIKKVKLLQKLIIKAGIKNKNNLQIVQKAREYAQSIVDTVREPLIVLSSNLRVISANNSFYQTFKVSPKETEGQFIYDLGNRQWNIPTLRVLLEDVLPKKKVFEDYKIEHKFKTIGSKIMLLNARQLDDVQMILLAIEDITERNKAENGLHRAKQDLEFILGATKTGLDIIDSNFNMVYIDPEWQKVYGEYKGKKCYKYFMGKDKVCSDCGVKKALETQKPIVSEEVLLKEGGRPIQVTTIPFQDKKGNWLVAEVNVDITERKKAEETLKKSEGELREEKLLLEQKNLALKELIEYMERARNKTKEDIAINAEEFIMPILKKLRIKGVSSKYLKLLECHLKELTSSFGRKITQRSAGLTPREIEICDMIKGGLRSKEISELLNVSSQTIDKHRRNIRKKLSISKKEVNLTSFLQKL